MYGKNIQTVINFARTKRECFGLHKEERKIAIDNKLKVIFSLKKKKSVIIRQFQFLRVFTFFSAFFTSLYFSVSNFSEIFFLII